MSFGTEYLHKEILFLKKTVDALTPDCFGKDCGTEAYDGCAISDVCEEYRGSCQSPINHNEDHDNNKSVN